MKILVDTTIWREALATGPRTKGRVVRELKELVSDYRAQIIGPVRQEVLSGIRRVEDFRRLQTYLNSFPDLPLAAGDFEKAAIFHNLCWAKSITARSIHFLMAAAAYRFEMPIFALDPDYERIADILPIELYRVEGIESPQLFV